MSDKKNLSELTEREFQELMGLAYRMGQQRMEPLVEGVLTAVRDMDETALVRTILTITEEAEENHQIVAVLLDKYGLLIDRLISAYTGANMPSPTELN